MPAHFDSFPTTKLSPEEVLLSPLPILYCSWSLLQEIQAVFGDLSADFSYALQTPDGTCLKVLALRPAQGDATKPVIDTPSYPHIPNETSWRLFVYPDHLHWNVVQSAWEEKASMTAYPAVSPCLAGRPISFWAELYPQYFKSDRPPDLALTRPKSIRLNDLLAPGGETQIDFEGIALKLLSSSRHSVLLVEDHAPPSSDQVSVVGVRGKAFRYFALKFACENDLDRTNLEIMYETTAARICLHVALETGFLHLPATSTRPVLGKVNEVAPSGKIECVPTIQRPHLLDWLDKVKQTVGDRSELLVIVSVPLLPAGSIIVEGAAVVIRGNACSSKPCSIRDLFLTDHLGMELGIPCEMTKNSEMVPIIWVKRSAGCGKTWLLKSIQKKCGAQNVTARWFDWSVFLESTFGGPQKYLSELFSKCGTGPSLILMDDAELLFGVHDGKCESVYAKVMQEGAAMLSHLRRQYRGSNTLIVASASIS